MKILFLSSFMTHGGAERFLFDLISHLDLSDHELSLISSGGYFSNLLDEKSRVHVSEIEGFDAKQSLLSSVMALKKHTANHAYDWVISNSFLTAMIARMAGVVGQHLYIVHNPLKGFYMPVIAMLGRFLIPQMVSISQFNKDILTGYGFPEKRISVIQNGVDTRAFLPKKHRGKNSVFTIGVVARLESYKGHLFLIRALETLRTQGMELELEIAGDGPYLDAIEAAVKDAGPNRLRPVPRARKPCGRYFASLGCFYLAIFAGSISHFHS